MLFYNASTIKNASINYPDIYFTPEYGKACEHSDNAVWELCQYKDLIYVYLKKSYLFENIVYYDLITPYGYSGYYFQNQKTLDEFIPLFRKEAFAKNYLTEVVRQNPYLNIDIQNHYDVICSKQIFSIEIENFDEYFSKTLKSSVRNILKKADALNYSYKIIKLNENALIAHFFKLYFINMKKVSAEKYYYFNDDYFNALTQLQNCYLINIFNNEQDIIGSSIIFMHNKFVHYHLSCNDNSTNCITNFLLNSIVKEFGHSKKFILGGGLTNNDGLYSFKKKISTSSYTYTIYKNIINEKIYEKIKNYHVDTCNNSYFPIHRKN